MFTVDTKLSKDLIEKFDEEDGVFYRFQNPDYDITGEYAQSWGMIFSSAEEARENAEEWGLEENEAVLPGKSCMETFSDIMKFVTNFEDSDVLLVFDGVDTYEYGHDGEFVAKYIAPRAVISMQDAVEFYENNF